MSLLKNLPSPVERATREIELKLEIDGAHGAQVHRHPLLRDREGRTRPQLTVYYDTADRSLRENGWSLRVRSAGGKFIQTIKPLTSAAGLIARDEIEATIDSIEPRLDLLAGGPLAQLVEPHRTGGLIPVMRSQVERTSWVLDQGCAAIRVDFDEGDITVGDASQRFSELEFELLGGEPAGLLVAARAIAEQLPARIGVLTKAERGERLASGAFERIAKAAPVDVHPAMSVAEAFEVMVQACLKHYGLNEPLVVGERRAAALHQTRVAMRRLRSAFTLFKSAVADLEYQYLREELRWFTSQLGDARNLDVYLQRDLPDAERDELQARRETAYDNAVDAMRSPRFRRLGLELVAWTAFGPWRRSKPARRPVGDYAGRRLQRLWDGIEAAGPLLARLDEISRHELRIQVKKMRYAIEFLRGLYPGARDEQKRFAAAIADLQESLGMLNDLATARELASAPPSDEWLIGEPEERIHLREAERAFRDLQRVGPFWRSPVERIGRP